MDHRLSVLDLAVQLTESVRMIKVSCPCGVTSEFPDELHNRSSVCPQCGAGLWIKRPTPPVRPEVKPGLFMVYGAYAFAAFTWAFPIGLMFVGVFETGDENGITKREVFTLTEPPGRFLLEVATLVAMASVMTAFAIALHKWRQKNLALTEDSIHSV